MKYAWILALLALAIYGLSGCASTSKEAGTSEAVPGEQKSEEARLAPGAGAGSASVKW